MGSTSTLGAFQKVSQIQKEGGFLMVRINHFAYENENQIKMLYESGKSLQEIEVNLNIPKTTAKRYLIKLKVPLRTLAETKIGEKNPRWKGDKAKEPAGHARARRKFNPPKGLEIHHVDGNPLNNNLENISFVSRKEHMKLDGRYDNLYFALPRINVTCPICHQQFETYIPKKGTQKKICCSRSCARKLQFIQGKLFRERNVKGRFVKL